MRWNFLQKQKIVPQNVRNVDQICMMQRDWKDMRKLHMEEELMSSAAIVEKNSETQKTWENTEKNVDNQMWESKVSLGMSFNFTRLRLIRT